MDPIQFRNRYEVNHLNGFNPFRNTSGEWVFRRDIILEPFTWRGGSGIKFIILETRSLAGGEIREFEMDRFCIYDSDNMDHIDLFSALASNDLRGNIAERMADTAFRLFFIKSLEAKKYLPELVRYHELFQSRNNQEKNAAEEKHQETKK